MDIAPLHRYHQGVVVHFLDLFREDLGRIDLENYDYFIDHCEKWLDQMRRWRDQDNNLSKVFKEGRLVARYISIDQSKGAISNNKRKVGSGVIGKDAGKTTYARDTKKDTQSFIDANKLTRGLDGKYHVTEEKIDDGETPGSVRRIKVVHKFSDEQIARFASNDFKAEENKFRFLFNEHGIQINYDRSFQGAANRTVPSYFTDNVSKYELGLHDQSACLVGSRKLNDSALYIQDQVFIDEQSANDPTKVKYLIFTPAIMPVDNNIAHRLILLSKLSAARVKLSVGRRTFDDLVRISNTIKSEFTRIKLAYAGNGALTLLHFESEGNERGKVKYVRVVPPERQISSFVASAHTDNFAKLNPRGIPTVRNRLPDHSGMRETAKLDYQSIFGSKKNEIVVAFRKHTKEEATGFDFPIFVDYTGASPWRIVDVDYKPTHWVVDKSAHIYRAPLPK